MKTIFSKLYYFLGSIYFAVILIALTALMVITGTFIESIHDSHKQASIYIYSHPAFLALLCGFFINILFSALRRWPFKRSHIPFLATHLGMLMIIAGTIVKQVYGLQGSMILMEGATSDRVMIADSKGLFIENFSPIFPFKKTGRSIPINKKDLIRPDPQLSIEILNRTDNCIECYEKWFKGDHVVIKGLPGLKVVDADQISDEAHIPKSYEGKLQPKDRSLHDFYALRTRNASESARRLFIQDLLVYIRNRYSEEVLWEGPLKDLLDRKNPWIHVRLHWNENPFIQFEVEGYHETIHIDLTGDDALINRIDQAVANPMLIEFTRPPAVAFIEDLSKDTHLYFFDPYGRISRSIDKRNELHSVVIYDEGYGGYSVQTEIPFPSRPSSLQDIRNAKLAYLSNQLETGLKIDPSLSPPLKLIQRACEKTGDNFIATTLSFLDFWDRSSHVLFPVNYPLPQHLMNVLEHLDWTSVPSHELEVCHVLSELFHGIDPELQTGKDPITVLKDLQWPHIEPLLMLKGDDVIEALISRVISLCASIRSENEYDVSRSTISAARMLSAYLRACSIRLSRILPDEIAFNDRKTYLETPLKRSYEKAKKSNKPENDIAKIHLGFRENGLYDEAEIAFDPYGQGLRWPVLNGRYLIRFQPVLFNIPYKIKLHQARQINYPGSSQAYSYEASMRFTDKRGESVQNVILSMNHTYETPEGYRFYLSDITPATEGVVKKIRLAVNYDPARYILTYPGCIIMAIGIALLFKRFSFFSNR